MTELRRRKVARGKGSVRNGLHKNINGAHEGLPALLQGVSLQQLFLNGFGVFMCLYLGYKHASYMKIIHETQTWFSNIKEVEREISFRTESGLYYSYYKTMVLAPSITDGLHQLTHDNVTEHPDTINILERMNIYQEVILSIMYRILPIKSWVEPVYFYMNTVWGLHAMLIWALFATSWMLSGSWLAGILAACFYIFNKVDVTRVEYVVPLRESFSLPFLWVQIAAISFFFRPNLTLVKEKLCIWIIFVSTFLFALFWQFNQFIFLLQAFALFGVWVLDMIPPRKVRIVFYAQAASLILTSILQYVNLMIFGSLVMSFIPASLLLMYFKGEELQPCSIPSRLTKAVFYCVSVLVLMVLFNTAIKILINIEADEHIFKFILSKFSIDHARDFDSKLYLCIDAFVSLPFNTFERLTKGVVFPFYVATHLVLLVVLFIAVLQNWSNNVHETENIKDHPAIKKTHLLSNRPELAFHAVCGVFFGALAMSTLRMKYLWTPYMCILASFGVSDLKMWKAVLTQLKTQGTMVQIVRHFSTLLTLVALLTVALPPALKELEELKEFWDPDTVALMEWINKDTPQDASFTGSMQLLAGVKLCTGRPITNHPHYEDKKLRLKTKDLMQIYGRRTPKDIHEIMKKNQANYMILEDSICLAHTEDGCRLPDIIDFDNGVLPELVKPEPNLVRSSVPRFCDVIRHDGSDFTRYFKKVFTNRTFRVHKVL
ncbi:protein C-mannosyl-transferase DPY19L3-like isoform X1 [Mytilus edulis]|uniref:protein C-mannosyl-transferase DPY19L3-like isoform X1 n=1 Tax=Mytilus edulis TaxID=6550 RepID=UPI0039EFA78C